MLQCAPTGNWQLATGAVRRLPLAKPKRPNLQAIILPSFFPDGHPPYVIRPTTMYVLTPSLADLQQLILISKARPGCAWRVTARGSAVDRKFAGADVYYVRNYKYTVLCIPASPVK